MEEEQEAEVDAHVQNDEEMNNSEDGQEEEAPPQAPAGTLVAESPHIA